MKELAQNSVARRIAQRAAQLLVEVIIMMAKGFVSIVKRVDDIIARQIPEWREVPRCIKVPLAVFAGVGILVAVNLSWAIANYLQGQNPVRILAIFALVVLATNEINRRGIFRTALWVAIILIVWRYVASLTGETGYIDATINFFVRDVPQWLQNVAIPWLRGI